jgi:HSP20 family protein
MVFGGITMFNLMPFGRGNNNLLNMFGELTKLIISNLNSSIPSLETNITDLGDKYIMEIDVTGFEKDDVDIVVNDHTLTINAKHDVRLESNNGYAYGYQRQFGAFTRNFDISDVNAGEINIDYRNGRMILDLPKKAAKQVGNK